jgi:hypothetical protein
MVFREFPVASTRLRAVADSLRNEDVPGEREVAHMESVPIANGTAYRWTMGEGYSVYWGTLVGTAQGTLLVIVSPSEPGDRELAERTWRAVLDGLDWRP